MPSLPPPHAHTPLPDFDPRTVPVSGVDSALPAVPQARTTAQALRERFAAPPIWLPEIAAELSFSARAPSRAAVLIPIVQRAEPTVLLTERTMHLSTHSGQVAFPGGRTDPEDADATATRGFHLVAATFAWQIDQSMAARMAQRPTRPQG